jgi:hypothetical protein
MYILRALGAFAAAALLTLTCSSPAAASDSAGATLYLTWSAPTVSSQVSSVTLTCFPTGGGEDLYFDADAACAALTTANGNFAALTGWWLDCTTYRGWPIRTTATGTWSGRSVNYDVLHANICEARKATGPVFVF